MSNSGTFRTALTGQTNGTTYRLRSATFDITGPTTVTLDSEANPDAAVLTASLAAGNYSIDLPTGWYLERLDGTSYVTIQATLVSPNPTNFTMSSGATTTVAYQFSTDGTVVTIGTGTLDVTIGVQEVAGVCGTTCQSVCVPQFTAAIAAALPSSACTPPQTVTATGVSVQTCSASTCTGETTGCEAAITWTFDASTGNYAATAAVTETMDASGSVLGLPVSCTDLLVSGTVQITVQPAYYTLGPDLRASVQTIQTTVTSFSLSGCGSVSSVLSTLATLVESEVAAEVSDQFTSYVQQASVACVQ